MRQISDADPVFGPQLQAAMKLRDEGRTGVIRGEKNEAAITNPTGSDTRVDTANVFVDESEASVSQQDVTHDTSHSGWRRDLVVVNGSGTASITKGSTTNGDKTNVDAPDVSTSSECLIAVVAVKGDGTLDQVDGRAFIERDQIDQIQDSGADTASLIDTLNFGSSLGVTDDGSGKATVDLGSHASTHQDGGSDELDVSGLAGANGTSGQFPQTDGSAVSWVDVDFSDLTGSATLAQLSAILDGSNNVEAEHLVDANLPLSDIAGDNITYDSTNEELDASGGGGGLSITTVTSSTHTTSGEDIIVADTSSNAITITLASSDASNGNTINVILVDGSNDVTVDTESSETIDPGSESSKAWSVPGSVRFTSDGTNWDTDLNRITESLDSESGVSDITVDAGLKPKTSGIHQLGNASLPWQDLFVSNAVKDDSGNAMLGSVAATGSVTLSSGTATIDTGVATSNTATFMVALGPSTDDAQVAADVYADSGSSTYKVDIEETDTSVGDPSVEYDIIRVR